MVDEKKNVLRVAGVPEHFNEPWKIGLEENCFLEQEIDLQWIDVKEGTGAMINKLKSNQVDLIVALTEGLINDIANGSNIRLIGTYVQSPLRWAVSSSIHSNKFSIDDLKGDVFGISRYQSGSHLMSCVLANQYGWNQSDISFSVQNNFETLRKSLNNNEISAFLWEYFMQKPFYDKKEIRRIGEIITPWPCFLIASTKEIISDRLKDIENLFVALDKSCSLFYSNSNESIQRISSKYNLSEQDAKDWFDSVQIKPINSISKSTIETTIDALTTANILNKSTSNEIFDPIQFIDTKFAKLTIDIKSMRLYNKPELLIALRNNLRVNGLTKKQMSYVDLLPFDQNHYYGTEILDLAVQKLQLDQNENKSNWIIQIGSNLAGCARYLAGKYQLKILAIELQNDLSQFASELTERCQLSHLIHHIAGNFISVSQHLQENSYQAILSWITVLHFTKEERAVLFDKSHRLIIDNGYFYCEDFIRTGNLTNEETQILEHDVYCRYLPLLDEYKRDLMEHGFKLIQIEDLTESWKSFIENRYKDFETNQKNLVEIHGQDIYQRLLFFYSSINKLFQGNHVGGVRIIAKK